MRDQYRDSTHLWQIPGAADGEEDEGTDDGRDASAQEGHHIAV